MRKGNLFIISGPSGIGKDTVLQILLKEEKNLKLSISSITRPMRTGEVEGEKYHFISRETFEQMLQGDAFLEHNVYCGNYYGTPKQPVFDWLEAGFDVILEIDVNGAMKIMESYPECVSVFMLPPSLQVLKHRLLKRGTEDEQTVKARLTQAGKEIQMASRYDYVMVNDVLEDAVADLRAIIRANTLLKKNNLDLIDEVKKDAESFDW